MRPSDDHILALEKALIDNGRIIEAGWIGLKSMAFPSDAPAIQVDEMRNAFFAGAQHLLACITRTLDPGEEPTEADMERLNKIHLELSQFIDGYVARNVKTEGNA